MGLARFASVPPEMQPLLVDNVQVLQPRVHDGIRLQDSSVHGNSAVLHVFQQGVVGGIDKLGQRQVALVPGVSGWFVACAAFVGNSLRILVVCA